MGFFDWLFGRKHDEPQPEPTPSVAPRESSEDRILASLDRVEALVETGVAFPVSSRVHHVTDTVRQILPRADAIPFTSMDSYTLMATATDYLPEALGAYLRLPRDWADTRPIENGKTALMLLIDQLDLLGGTMDKIADALNRRDAQALIVHGRFLQEKFGTSSAQATLDVTSAPAPAPNPLELS